MNNERMNRPKSEVSQKPSIDWDLPLLLTCFGLVAFGIVMLYSASAVMASNEFGDHFYLVKEQLIKLAISSAGLFVALQLDYRLYRKLVYPILVFTLLLLGLVLIPGIGSEINGARRWLNIAGLTFQPAELAKLTTIIFLAYSVSKKGEQMSQFVMAFIPHIIVVGAMISLLMLQPDFGSSVLLIMITTVMLFVSGARILYLSGFIAVGTAAGALAISMRTYRLKRIMAFLDPWKYRETIGYQISESLISIGSGGIFGKGLGSGKGKLGYVPELWNDFIGALVAEELGLIGMIVLAGLFAAYLWRGLKISWECSESFGKYLAFGITSLIGIQATANLGVVTGLLPTKGLTLPFVSYGGSSLLVLMYSTGILLNISRDSDSP